MISNVDVAPGLINGRVEVFTLAEIEVLGQEIPLELLADLIDPTTVYLLATLQVAASCMGAWRRDRAI